MSSVSADTVAVGGLVTKASDGLLPNNLDLIRLVAAFQVVVFHASEHLDLFPGLRDVLGYVPGVPIFFFVSGMLITRSWERNPKLKNYALNRALRIYPAMWVCVAVGVVSALLISNEPIRGTATEWTLFAAANITGIQAYNPDFFRGYGIGVLNGALWTITVELQFYLLTPLLYWLGVLRGRRLDVLVVLLLLFNHIFWGAPASTADATWFKLVQLSAVPWIGFYLLGAWVRRHWSALAPWFRERMWAWLVVWVASVAVLQMLGVRTQMNVVSPLAMIPLLGFVLACAYTAPRFADRLLRRNDISYGIYIYHTLVIGAVVELGYRGTGVGFAIVLILPFFLASASWWGLERRVLRLKAYLDRSDARL